MTCVIKHVAFNGKCPKYQGKVASLFLNSGNNLKSCYIIILFILEWLFDKAFSFFFWVPNCSPFFVYWQKRQMRSLWHIFIEIHMQVIFVKKSICGSKLFNFLHIRKCLDLELTDNRNTGSKYFSLGISKELWHFLRHSEHHAYSIM